MPHSKTYRLRDGFNREYASDRKGILGGHRGLKIFGRLDCPSALRWIEKGHYVRQRVFFADGKTAVQAGYRPCACCMKDDYKNWKDNPAQYRTEILSGRQGSVVGHVLKIP